MSKRIPQINQGAISAWYLQSAFTAYAQDWNDIEIGDA
jgi:hypothetical protein